MKHITKSLTVASVAVLALTATGCDRFSRSKAPENKPAKLVKIDNEVVVLNKVASFSLPQAGGRFKGVYANKKDVIDLQVAQLGDMLIAASGTGVVSAFDGNVQAWLVNVGDTITSGVATDGRLAVIGTRSGKVVAFDAMSGNVVWERNLSSSSLAPALIGEGRVMILTNDGVIYALNANDGNQVWQFSTQNPTVSVRGAATPIHLDTNTALFGTADGRIHAINPQVGTPLWTRRIGRAIGGSRVHQMSDVDGTPLVVGQYLYVPSYSGQLMGFDMSTGRALFVSELASTKSLALLGNQLIGTSIHGDVVAFDAMTGDVVWENSELKYRRLTNPVTIGNHVAVGDLDGVVHVFDNTGKIISRTNTKGQLTSLQVQQNRLYTQSSQDVVTVWQF
ncbi:outer membrane protein assembly factor BamB [Moraxella nonliquefaciens]|mgnify:CR=1 FL=1|jgi:outer membrane assembly lipoprotein yfgL|uniref:outer membrane protein assembly factor BamB n=1 Tax=Moraxella nonliquefaciens TaxID=478 RepID=UPI001EF4BEEB|nr:outer membrane protein assembly factor BamB [Moraxella nonliquefaciens]MCG7411240.1 outer membrane protein assembly factor BamB [Moraxella nonliquefaciens]